MCRMPLMLVSRGKISPISHARLRVHRVEPRTTALRYLLRHHNRHSSSSIDHTTHHDTYITTILPAFMPTFRHLPFYFFLSASPSLTLESQRILLPQNSGTPTRKSPVAFAQRTGHTMSNSNSNAPRN